MSGPWGSSQYFVSPAGMMLFQPVETSMPAALSFEMLPMASVMALRSIDSEIAWRTR
jgi:hypothetical protein